MEGRPDDVQRQLQRALPPRWRRWVPLGLVAYGLLGLTLLAAAAVLVSRPLEQLAELGSTAETQRGALVRSLRSTSRTLDDASRGFSGFGESLGIARRSTTRAADLSRDVSTTMSSLARAMNITVFGAQPLAELAPGFERAAAQLTDLGTDLDGIGAAMVRNADDVERARADLLELRRQVDELVLAAERTQIPVGSPAALGTLRLGLYGLIVWLAAPAVASLLLGLALWRATRDGPGPPTSREVRQG